MRIAIVLTGLIVPAVAFQGLPVGPSQSEPASDEQSASRKLDHDKRPHYPLPSQAGTVAPIEVDDAAADARYSKQLHFCVFENGKHDMIYVGTKYGMWSSGEFDLYINNKKVFTGKVKHLVYGGTMIHMGDVMTEQPRSNFPQFVKIGRISGWFK